MEALVQSCLRKTLANAGSLPNLIRALAGGSTHASTFFLDSATNDSSMRGSSSIQPIRSHASLQQQQVLVSSLIFHTGAGSYQQNWSYQSWFAAGAFPAAVAAFSGLALAKEKAPLPLSGEVVLYQYEACPFCNKVKAFLDYHDINYKVVEVNPIGKKELKWSEYKKVPVLVVDGQPLSDSTSIISKLDERIYGKDQKPVESNAEEEQWRKWVDDYFVHLLSPNIYRTPSEALEAFDYITTNGNFTAWERAYAKYSGAAAMYFVGKRLKKKHNIEDERRELFQAADKWTDAVGSRKFMGGDKPNLADLAVFGVLRPIRSMQTGRELMENSRIGSWYSRMEAEVGTSNRLSET